MKSKNCQNQCPKFLVFYPQENLLSTHLVIILILDKFLIRIDFVSQGMQVIIIYVTSFTLPIEV
jgi:hypothetical protein